MVLSYVNKEDILDISLIHLKAFKDFFLSRLGKDFLFTYYNAIRINDRGILLGCFEDDVLLGFCAATTLSAGFNTYLIKNNAIQFTKTGLRFLFTKPNALVRLVRNFIKRSPSIADEGNYAELLSIGVSPTIQGRGVGKLLLFELENELKAKNVRQLSLTTDYYNNNKTLKFYQTTGYRIMYDFIAYPNRRMYRLIKEL